MRGKTYDLVVCAGVQAKKWWANDHPDQDWQSIQKLLDVLRSVHVRRFVLISTVDVYPEPSGVDEETPINPSINHAYGRHRYAVEQFVRDSFSPHYIIRLPGLFGNGIKKNVIHDLMYGHELQKINPAAIYQYYSLDRIARDLEKVISENLRLVNFASEPVSTREIIERFFPLVEVGPEAAFKAAYDMRSRYGVLWGSPAPGYLFSRVEILNQLAEFLRRQPRCLDGFRA
ncbi:MAG: NAD-dependent epimerase/dehydratase family protein [Verrucomicrobiia bacterium]